MNDKTRRLTIEDAKFKAHECREMAKRAKADSQRIMLEHMAETWERIGKEIGGVDVMSLVLTCGTSTLLSVAQQPQGFSPSC